MHLLELVALPARHRLLPQEGLGGEGVEKRCRRRGALDHALGVKDLGHLPALVLARREALD